jgi:Tfp pilus assembly protein PilX
MTRRRIASAGAQRGYTVVVALIMLTALALLAASAVRSGSTNLRAVGNMQSRQEALASAQAAIERTISTPQFTSQPAAVAARPIAVDLDGDGSSDYTATLSPAPSCYNYRTVKTTELDPDVANDVPCMRSSAGNAAGIESTSGSSALDSLCADSEWNLRVVIGDASSGTSVAVNQGVAVRGIVTDAANSCP